MVKHLLAALLCLDALPPGNDANLPSTNTKQSVFIMIGQTLSMPPAVSLEQASRHQNLFEQTHTPPPTGSTPSFHHSVM